MFFKKSNTNKEPEAPTTVTASISVSIKDTPQDIFIRFNRWGELLEFRPMWLDLPVAARRLILPLEDNAELEERLDSWRERLRCLLPVITSDPMRHQPWPALLEPLRNAVSELLPAGTIRGPYPGVDIWMQGLESLPPEPDHPANAIRSGTLFALAGDEKEIEKGKSTLSSFGAIARYPLLCLLGENQNVFFSLAYSGEAFLLELAAQKLLSTNKQVRHEVLHILGNCDWYPAVDLVLEHITRQPEDQKTAVYALGSLADNRAIPILAELLNSAETDDDRLTVMNALRQINDPSTHRLACSFLDDPNDKIKTAALSFINTSAKDSILEKKLLELLKGIEKDWGFTSTVASTLGYIGSAESIPVLLTKLDLIKSNFDNPDAIYACRPIIASLYRLGYAETIQLLPEQSYEKYARLSEFIIGALSEMEGNAGLWFLEACLKDNQHLEKTTEALGRIGTTEALQVLLRAMENPDSGVRLAAMKVLGNLRCTDAVPGLLRLLHYPDCGNEALKSLAKIGDPAAAPGVYEAACSLWDTSSVALAWNVLGRLGDERALQPLLRYTNSKILPETKAKMVLTISRMGKMEAAPVLRARIGKETPEVEAVILMALGRLGDYSAFDILARSIQSYNNNIAAGAAKGLEYLNLPECMPVMLENAHNTWPEVRTIAQSMLAGSRHAPGIQLLMDGLRHKNAMLRREYIRTVARADNSVFIPVLVERLNDPFNIVRKEAVLALSKFKHPEVIRALTGILNDTNVEVRTVARNTLHPPEPERVYYYAPYLPQWPRELFNDLHI